MGKRGRNPALGPGHSKAVAARIVSRERLFAMLDSADDGRAIWVAAEAGAGKTSLATSYLKDRKLPALWYRTTAADSDLATFFHYFGEAVRRARPKMKNALPHLTPEYLPSIDAFATRYFLRALGGLRHPFVVLLDEFQEGLLETPLVNMIVLMMAALPANVSLIVLSRNLPPAAFARLHANGALSLVGSEQMRFTLEETQELAQLMECDNEQTIADCMRRSRGWAAGIVLLLQHARSGAAPLAMPPEEVLFDYFAAELYARTDQDARDLMLHTAHAPSFTAEEAVELCGNKRAAVILAQLRRHNAFIYQSAASDSFEYHPLFCEFLLKRADAELAPGELAQARLRTAAILETSGRYEAAAEIYIALHEWERLIELILRVAPVLLPQGRLHNVHSWTQHIPEKHLAASSSPELLYWVGMSQISSSPVAARGPLSRAYEAYLAMKDERGALLACCAVLEAYATEMGDFNGADAWIDRLAGVLPELPVELSPEIEVRMGLAFECMRWCRPEHPLMRQWIERLRSRITLPLPPALGLAYAYAILMYDIWLGNPKASEAVISFGRRSASMRDIPPFFAFGWWRADLSYHCFVGDFQRAREAADRAEVTCEQLSVELTHGYDYSARGVLGLSTGDIVFASFVLDRAKPYVDTSRGVNGAFYYYLRSALALAEHKVTDALNDARTQLKLMEGVAAPFFAAVGKIAAAASFIENELFAEAEALLDDTVSFTQQFGSAALAWHFGLYKAYSRLRQGDRAAAELFLPEALSLARSNGCVVWDISMPLYIAARLAAAALQSGIEVDYVRDVIRRRGLAPPSEDVEDWPWPIRISTLGRFEVSGEEIDPKPKRKAGHQPLALLKLLVINGGRDVDVRFLASSLWQDAAGDTAENALSATLHRLRRHLGREDAILLQDNKLSLNLDVCYWDAARFERLVEHCEAAARSEGRIAEFERAAERALTLYRGPFLGAETDAPRVAVRRERLRQEFYRHVRNLGDYYERQGLWEFAERVYRRAVVVEPLSEVFYRQLIGCLKSAGRHSEALDTYYRCREVLAKELGTAPSAATRQLIDGTF